MSFNMLLLFLRAFFLSLPFFMLSVVTWKTENVSTPQLNIFTWRQQTAETDVLIQILKRERTSKV